MFNFFSAVIFLKAQNFCGEMLKWFQLMGFSSQPGYELSWSNCMENSTPKPRRMEIWFKFIAGVRVIRGIRVMYQSIVVVGWCIGLTQCRTATEVKHGRARLGVGWVTAQVIN